MCPADLPVRMALGETHVIALTKAALAEAGVDLNTLEAAVVAGGSRAGRDIVGAVERSKAVLLVKNLPYSASQQDLQVCSGMAPKSQQPSIQSLLEMCTASRHG